MRSAELGKAAWAGGGLRTLTSTVTGAAVRMFLLALCCVYLPFLFSTLTVLCFKQAVGGWHFSLTLGTGWACAALVPEELVRL